MGKAQNLLFLQHGKCFYCGGRLDPKHATIDHVIPSSKGGGNRLDNVVACCRYINSVFGNLSPKEKIAWVRDKAPDFVCPYSVEGEKERREEAAASDLQPVSLH